MNEIMKGSQAAEKEYPGTHLLRQTPPIAVNVLPGGYEVLIRRTTTEDNERFGEMLRRSSRETVYRRFHSPYSRVPEWIVAYLTSAEHRQGLSLVALVDEEIVGHIMCIPTSGGDAEVAVIVEDEWQRRGLGKLLLSKLGLEAASHGIDTFIGYVLAENRAMLGLIRTAFDEPQFEIEGGVYFFRVRLSAIRTVYEQVKTVGVAPATLEAGENL